MCQELGEVVHFSVFLWAEEAELVLTDIDGTITESDVRGHVAAFLGLASYHAGVVELFHKIGANGYKFIYLTARSLSLSTK